jgi:hypothetical protein
MPIPSSSRLRRAWTPPCASRTSARVDARTVRHVVASAATLLLFVFAFVTCGPRPREAVVDDAPEGPAPAPFDASVDAPPTVVCQGRECDRVTCEDGRETTISGTVFAPNGTLPVSGAVVYVPNGEVPPIADGARCETCASWLPERPAAITTSSTDGSFVLHDVPIGLDVPVVVQVGKWRRMLTLPKVERCVDHPVDRELSRLPRNRREGRLPRIALTTGACDDLGCLLPKLGIDPDEIGVPSDGDAKSVHVYLGAMDPARAPRGAPLASSLWSSAASLSRYDMILLSCECGERLENKGPAANEAMTRYLEGGGRIFTTDFMYTWYRDTPSSALRSAIDVAGGGHEGGKPVSIVPGEGNGKALAEWLRASTPASPQVTEGQVDFESVFDNLRSVDKSRVRVWAQSSRPNAPSSGPGARIVSIDFPLQAAPEKRCGRAVHIDAHVNQASDDDRVGPDYPRTCAGTMGPGEHALAYFLFHLATCITPPATRPTAPSPR